MRAVFLSPIKTATGGRVGIKQVAKGIDSPEHFFAKILQDLSRKGIIQSAKGPNGGFYLDTNSLARPLSEVVETIDGSSLFHGYALGPKHCSEVEPCPLHNEFKEIRNRTHHLLLHTTIGEFNKELVTGLFSLKK